VETAAELGAEVIGGPMYAPIGYLPGHRATGEEWKWAAEAFAGLGGLLEQAGMTLALEPVNRAETFFLRTAAEAARLVEAIGHPQVGVTIDTFHANVEEKSLVAAIELLGPRLRHVHASENDRGLLGSGHVDFAGMYGALRRVGFEGCVVVEGFGYSPAEGDAPGFLWADEEVSPERMAREGVAFLEGLSGRGRTVEVELAR
jgi:D-psicose/D-tagatose/L-ribulose 3-epimerase